MTSVHRDRGAPGAAPQVAKLAGKLRPRVVHREGPRGREDHRPVAGDRQERLPRRQHPRGVRRRWRRHRRHRRGLRGARRAGLPAADDGRQPGDLRHRHRPLRHRGAEAALAPRHLRRHRHDGLRDHRARRRHQLPQHHHHRPPRRRRVGAQRPQDLHLRRRRGRQRARRRAHRGREDRQAQALPLRGADRRRRASSAPSIPMEIVSPEKQFQVFIDDVRLPADALVGDEDGGLVQLFAGLNPERIMAASLLDRPGPLRAREGDGVRQGARGLQGRRSAPTRRSRTRWRRRTSRSSWPG